MKVKCKANRAADLPPAMIRGSRTLASPDHVYALQVGVTYTVCAIYRVDEHMGYVIDSEQLYAEPSALFEIVDVRLSRCWIIGESQGEVGGGEVSYRTDWGYPEFVTDPEHYNRLVDGDRHTVALFNRYRRFMELEFPDPTDESLATHLEDNWLQCAFCFDAWQDTLRLGRAQCPKCKRIMNNPLYRDSFDPAILSAL